MCFCSCSRKDMPAFKDAIYRGHPDKNVIHRTLGTLIIRDADNFTTVTQPMIVDDRLVYGITQYANDEIVFVHDDDDLPLFEDEGMDMSVLPLGLRKAAALERAIHLENVQRYGLEDVASTTNRYFPKNPRTAYDRARRKKKLSQTRSGRLLLSILEFLGW